MKYLKSFSIFSIPYFSACGGLYHIAFWGTFNINGLEYIGISELIISFVYPFLSFFGFFLIGFLFNRLIIDREQILPHGGGRDTSVGKFLNSKIVITFLVILWLFIVIFLYKHDSTGRWIIWAILVGIVPFLYLDRSGFLIEAIENHKLRINIIQTLIYIPIFSFAAGKYNSELIYKNQEFKYTVVSNINSGEIYPHIDTLKLLGRTENYLFLSDLANNTTLMLRSESVDSLILKEYVH